MKTSLLFLAVACALLALSSPASAAGPGAYRTKVNAICKAGVAKINAVPTPKAPAGYGAYFAAEGALGYQLLKRVIAVTPPKSLQPLVLNAVRPQGKAVDVLLAIAQQIKKGADPVKAYNASKAALTRWTTQANTAWRRAGLNACAG